MPGCHPRFVSEILKQLKPETLKRSGENEAEVDTQRKGPPTLLTRRRLVNNGRKDIASVTTQLNYMLVAQMDDAAC